MNVMRTGMLLAFMTALFMGVGFLIGGTGGMMIALVITAGMNLFSYWNSDKMVLKMHHAVEVDEANAPEYSVAPWSATWQRTPICPCRKSI